MQICSSNQWYSQYLFGPSSKQTWRVRVASSSKNSFAKASHQRLSLSWIEQREKQRLSLRDILQNFVLGVYIVASIIIAPIYFRNNREWRTKGLARGQKYSEMKRKREWRGDTSLSPSPQRCARRAQKSLRRGERERGCTSALNNAWLSGLKL